MAYSGGVGPVVTPAVTPIAGTKILLRRSAVEGKTPVVDDAEYGELFINYHSAAPMLCFKDNSDNIVEIRPVTQTELALGELTDVDTSGAVDGMVLSYDGSEWVAISAASIAVDVDLGYTPAADGGTVTNTAGDNADIPLANGSNAGLSLNDYTTPEKSKLAGVEAGANVNVNPDWNAIDGDAEILNKPTLFSGDYDDLINKPDIPEELSDLSDVDTSGASTGQLLRYNGTSWEPGTPSAVSVDLGYTPAESGGTVTNDAGADAALPLVDDANAGLMAPADKEKLDTAPDDIQDAIDSIGTASRPDLGYTSSRTAGVVTNSVGDDATIPVVDTSIAGLMRPGDKEKLNTAPADIQGAIDDAASAMWTRTDTTLTTTNAGDDVVLGGELTLPPPPGQVGRSLNETMLDHVNAKDFGALGDGSNDDSDEIQAAIDYCVNSGHALYFPAGKYIIRKTIVVPVSNIKIYGDGINTEFAMRPGVWLESPFHPGAFDSIFFLIGTEDAVSYSPIFRDLLFSCPQTLASLGSVGLLAARVSQGVFENVRFQGFKDGLQLYACARSFVNHCSFHTGGRELSGDQADIATRANQAIRVGNIRGGQYDCTGLHFSNLEVHSGFQDNPGWNNAITVTSCDGLYITNSHFIGCAETYLQEAQNTSVIGAIRFSNCYFDQYYKHCVRVTTPASYSGGALDKAITNDLVFDSCYFRGGQPGSQQQVMVDPDATLATQKQVKFVGCDFLSAFGASFKTPKNSSTGMLIATGCKFAACNKDNLDRGNFIDGGAILTVIADNVFDSSMNSGLAAEGYAMFFDNLNNADQEGSTFNITGNHVQANTGDATDTGKTDNFIRIAGMGTNANRSGFVKENNSWSTTT